MAPSEAVLSLINRHFKNHAQVEISRNDQCFTGSWYHGTVLRVYKTSRTAIVQYETLMDEGAPLREEVTLVQVRPAQPEEERHEYAINDYVDVYKRDGWWEGMVIDFHAEKNEYVVFCKHNRGLRTCKVSRLRPHREWVYGNWHPELNAVPVRSPKMKVPASKKRKTQPQDDLSTSSKDVSSDTQDTYSSAEMQDVPSRVKTTTKYTPNRKQAKRGFKPGQPVRSPKMKMPASKKCKIQPQDDSPTSSKDVSSDTQDTYSSAEMQDVPSRAETSTKYTPNRKQAKRGFKPGQPVRSPKMKVPASKKCKIQPQDDSSTSSKDVSSDTQDTYSSAEMQDVPSRAETSTKYTPNRKQAKHGFKPGQPVEVRSDDEGFKGAWFPATVVQTLNANKYRIEYDYFMTDDGKSKLIEKVDGQSIRPCPPKVERVCFNHLEIVDAFYNDCWWAGAIVRALQNDEYIVYFKTSDEEIKFNHSQLREHRKWRNGQWVN